MKKIIFILLLLSLLVNVKAYAIDGQIFDMRNKFFEESKKIKVYLPKSRDTIWLTSLFDSCIMTTMQLDAYVSMLGIFNAIKRENLTPAPIGLLISWINEIKKSNDLNLRILVVSADPIDADTKTHIESLRMYFTDLNKILDAELKKFYILNDSLSIKKR
ncbi:MAG: hypothetical protein Q8R31_02130 [Candidatus Omnitrophota bacterium]|nr:hypothetical protein [Candidatus Omnitrophota bacterium]